MQRKDGIRALAHIAVHHSTHQNYTVDSLNLTAARPARKAMAGAAAAVDPRFGPLGSAEWQAVLGGEALSAGELSALNAMAQLDMVPAGSMLFTRLQAAEHLVAVVDGAVGLGLARDDAPFHLEHTVRGPHWLDVSSAWLGGGYGQDARVVNEALVLRLPVEAVRQLICRHTDMLDRLLVALAQNVHSLTGVTHDLMHKDAEKRLAAWLLQRAVPAPEGGSATISLKERKRDIAAQLAITPETLSRMMRQLNRKGVIEVQGYAVNVLSLTSLQALARD